jgi:hypothetical protein
MTGFPASIYIPITVGMLWEQLESGMCRVLACGNEPIAYQIYPNKGKGQLTYRHNP